MIVISKPLIGPEEKEAVCQVLDSGFIAQGPKVKELEQKFAEVVGVEHAIATSSGTTALHTMLLAHGIGPGDEVITSPFTFIATANSILYTGARPIFVDIDPTTYNIDPQLIENAITSKTKAILVVHLYGLACAMTGIKDIAERHSLLLLEDAAQSLGASHCGQKVGSFGTAAFSLYATKNITSAEGGMITTNNHDIAEKCTMIRQHGTLRRYYHDFLGFNFRLTDVHAAIGIEQLKKLDMFTRRRQENALFLSNNLRGVQIPSIPADTNHVFHQYTIRIPTGIRNELIEHLESWGVGSAIFYPLPIHKQTLYRLLGEPGESLPESEKAATEVLSLPVHPALELVDLERIVNAVNAFFENQSME